MTDLTDYLEVTTVGTFGHLAFDLLEFDFFRKSEKGNALVFGSPRLLAPLVVFPYVFALEVICFRGKRFFVKLDGRTVGLFVVKFRDDTVFIGSLAVSPACRKSGVGLFMLNWIERLCRQTKSNLLELSVLKANTPAQRLYKKFGFMRAADKKWSLILRKRIRT